MLLQRRAVYNLIHLPDATGLDELEPWQKENYRKLPDHTLLNRLQEQGMTIPKLSTFQELASNFSSPDEMADEMAPEKDEIYLLLFELWRRHLPQQRCPSVFCDELDFQISCFEEGDFKKKAELEEIVEYLLQIFEDHVDEGADPAAIYHAFQEYCAHDLDGFLYGYFTFLIAEKRAEYAYELLEGYYPFVRDRSFFDFLLARIAILYNEKEGKAFLEKTIKKVKRLDLAEEMLLYLSEEKEHGLLCLTAQKSLPMIEDEESFNELIDLLSLHFQRMQLDHHPFEQLKSQAPLQKKMKELRKLLKSTPVD